MIEDVRAALEPFSKHLTIDEHGNVITVTVKDWLPDFNSVKDIVKGFEGKYHPFDRQTKQKAYFTIEATPEPARMEGSAKDAIVLALDGYAKEFEMRSRELYKYAESFRQMAEDLRRIKQ